MVGECQWASHVNIANIYCNMNVVSSCCPDPKLYGHNLILLHYRGNGICLRLWGKFTTDVTKQVRRIDTFTGHGKPNNSTKYKYVFIFLIFKLITRKLILSHFGSQFQWSKRERIFTALRAIREHRDAYYREPPTFTKEKGRLNWHSYWHIPYNMPFFPP